MSPVRDVPDSLLTDFMQMLGVETGVLCRGTCMIFVSRPIFIGWCKTLRA